MQTSHVRVSRRGGVLSRDELLTIKSADRTHTQCRQATHL